MDRRDSKSVQPSETLGLSAKKIHVIHIHVRIEAKKWQKKMS